ncbi:ATM interactor [Spea bombifrons]|uniref:ATM interactor n=1 Tax=Spea bombifrons TaxID=233779 RepID=UPI00234B1EC5|nr:ATM interactor [Spea bombifrons]
MAARMDGGGARVRSPYSCEHWEIVKPSVSELSREVRNNILCTVNGCGKVLPNPPALNMHLVKSHGVQDGIVNPTLRKDLKASQKLYCCPIEGCPRGTNRPFSQFSRVKQHFMKMHAEKKHKCDKCGNSYGTEWDLKRHEGYCGKIFRCTCGCPYASRTALLSHTHRMGHEIPIEHRDPPVKKRKLEASVQNQKTVNEESVVKHDLPAVYATEDKHIERSRSPPSTETSSDVTESSHSQPNPSQKLLLPKPKLAFIKLPVMQVAHLPVLLSSSACSVKPVVVAVNDRGSVMTTVQIVPHYNGAVLQTVENEVPVPANLSLSRNASYGSLDPMNSFVQVSLDKPLSNGSDVNGVSSKNSITSDVQTDLSYFAHNILSGGSWPAESSISSCSQTDLSFGAQVSLPINVETQTFQQNSDLTSTARSETNRNPCFPGGISRETQTNGDLSRESTLHVDQAVMCENLFNGGNSLYTVSTQTSQTENDFMSGSLDQNLLNADDLKEIREESIKSAPYINFHAHNGAFANSNMTDNQTQTMELLSDLEKILSDNMSTQSLDNRSLLTDVGTGAETNLASNCPPNPGIDFDIEEFFSASNIQTQTEESELGNLNSEYLDIETQTDFLFSEDSAQSYSNKGNSGLLGMEMFDTQTQTDLNFFLDNSSHLPLGGILKQSSFSLNHELSDCESNADVTPDTKNMACHGLESQVQLNSAETQTTDSCFDHLGNLFLTSNETQTAMGDFLLADLAWNTIESQFSSVETQTCEELFSLFSEKSQN